MKKTIFYWSPCLNPVGTLKSTLNSAVATSNYGKSDFEVTLINACGEWDNYLEYLEKNNVEVINFKLKFYKYLPKEGYLQSRFSYLVIYFLCLFPLIKLLLKLKPDFLIAHLITSLPLTIMNFLRLKTKFILRISGMPKLNFLRKFFWKRSSNKIHLITCPSIELKNKLNNIKLFELNKLHFLPDAIIDIKKFIIDSKKDIKKFDNKKLILAVGRLTKQKNFTYLINEFSDFSNNNDEFILIILGDGEEKIKLKKQIKNKNLENKVYLLGYQDNVYKYFSKAEIFILSSLWEDPGFVIIEAALSNLFVISSNCPNGPTEFLDYGKNGILYQSDKKGELAKSIQEYCTIKDTKEFKLTAKKNSIKYTKFRHFLKLKSLLQI